MPPSHAALSPHAHHHTPPPPPPPPPPPKHTPKATPKRAPKAVPEAVVSRYGRERKEKTRFGDAGELEGPAKRFKSAPAPPKAPRVNELLVPDFCTVGATVRVDWSCGGNRQLFSARVEKIRAKFPRIVVRFIADAEGRTQRIALPEPVTAYVHAGLVRA